MGSRGASSGRLKNKGIHGNGIVAIRKTNNYKIGTNPNKLDAATQKGLKRIIRRRTNHERFLREERVKRANGHKGTNHNLYEPKRYSQFRYARLMDGLEIKAQRLNPHDQKKEHDAIRNRINFLREKNKKIRPKGYLNY